MARGAVTRLDDLIALRHPARELHLFSRQRARQQLAGAVRTHFRGRGIEFEEVRAYQPGDDIRAIDWRVTARTGDAHTRVFREERERPVLIAVDQRAGMAFGTQRCFKSVQAAVTAALLGWAALSHSDRIGGLVFDNLGHDEVRPRRSKHALLSFLHTLHSHNTRALQQSSPAAVQTIDAVTHELRRITRPGSAVFFISDFDGLSDDGMTQFGELKRHNDVTAIAISDPMESELPANGGSVFTDGTVRCRVDVRDPALGLRFSQRFQAGRDTLRRELGLRGIPLISLSTSDSPVRELARYYSMRRRRAAPLAASR